MNFEKINTEQVLFKYLDFPKFISLLVSQKITFVKPCLFEDIDDCSFPDFTKIKTETKPILKQMRIDRATRNVANFIGIIKNKPTHNEPENIFMYIFVQLYNSIMYNSQNISSINSELIREFSQKLTDAYVKNDIQSIINILVEIDECDSFIDRDIGKYYKNNTFVSCWHINSNESDAMWKIYSNKKGIAIKTTIDKLKNYLDYSELTKEGYEIKSDRVKYHNIDDLFKMVDNKNGQELVEQKLDDPVHYFFIKKECYAYENEYRVLFYQRPNLVVDSIVNNEIIHKLNDSNIINANNVYAVPVNVSLEEFIDEIIISPYAPRYYMDVLCNLMDKMQKGTLKQKIACSHIKINYSD